MVSKIVLTLCIVIVAVSAIPSPAGFGGPPGGWGAGAGAGFGGPPGGWGAGAGANPFIPPWVAAAPWFPQWVPCTGIGAVCVDCTTKLVCTKVGGLQRACTDPTLPFCNLGECSATPTAECAPPTPVNSGNAAA